MRPERLIFGAWADGLPDVRLALECYDVIAEEGEIFTEGNILCRGLFSNKAIAPSPPIPISSFGQEVNIGGSAPPRPGKSPSILAHL